MNEQTNNSIKTVTVQVRMQRTELDTEIEITLSTSVHPDDTTITEVILGQLIAEGYRRFDNEVISLLPDAKSKSSIGDVYEWEDVVQFRLVGTVNNKARIFVMTSRFWQHGVQVFDSVIESAKLWGWIGKNTSIGVGQQGYLGAPEGLQALIAQDDNGRPKVIRLRNSLYASPFPNMDREDK